MKRTSPTPNLVTSGMLGCFRDDAQVRQEFLSMRA